MTATEPILEAIDLAKHYRVRTKRFGRSSLVRAAEDISLALHPGRVTAVVGESGSGKSTVSRLLARTTTPTAGELLLGRHAAEHPGRGRPRLPRRGATGAAGPVRVAQPRP